MVIYFDLDDTLYRLYDPFYKAYQKVLALIWVCIEIDIYPVRNTDEYYLGGYNQLSCLCLIILGILVYKVIKIISLKKQLKKAQLCIEHK